MFRRHIILTVCLKHTETFSQRVVDHRWSTSVLVRCCSTTSLQNNFTAPCHRFSQSLNLYYGYDSHNIFSCSEPLESEAHTLSVVAHSIVAIHDHFLYTLLYWFPSACLTTSSRLRSLLCSWLLSMHILGCGCRCLWQVK